MAELPQRYTLNDVVCWFLAARGRREEVNFTNWLARLFLRMAKRQRLSDPRDVGEVLADSHSSQDDRLMSFLQQVSVRPLRDVRLWRERVQKAQQGMG